jgi:hypothetical protein
LIICDLLIILIRTTNALRCSARPRPIRSPKDVIDSVEFS